MQENLSDGTSCTSLSKQKSSEYMSWQKTLAGTFTLRACFCSYDLNTLSPATDTFKKFSSGYKIA